MHLVKKKEIALLEKRNALLWLFTILCAELQCFVLRNGYDINELRCLTLATGN